MIVNLFTKKKINLNANEEMEKKSNNIINICDKYKKSMDILNQKMNAKKNRSFDGIVAVGERKMKNIGFPTANIAYNLSGDNADGFYYAKVKIDDEELDSLAFVIKSERTAEVYIFDFNKDIYGKRIFITLVKFMAVLKDFNEISLKDQFKQHVEKIKKVFLVKK